MFATKKPDDKKPEPMMTRLFHACLLILGTVIVLWLALELLAQFWGWLLLVAAVVALIWAAVWFVGWRRDRRW